MKIALICFSLTGQETGEKLCCGLEKAGITAVLAKKSKYLPDSIKGSTSAWAGEKFPDSDALIFIGATGIAVRSIAPYVASKKSDPAVLVIDECGRFVISLLSGHLGGANELALKADDFHRLWHILQYKLAFSSILLVQHASLLHNIVIYTEWSHHSHTKPPI